jgi:SAM-dependent methyltransferase
MEKNKTTLNTYQEHFDNYVAKTPQETSGTQKEWIESLLAQINHDTPILEIGSAFGRDAAFIQNAGFHNLTVTDAFDAAIDELNNRGFNAAKLNILTDEPEGKYGLIFASAVFLHFTAEELEMVLRKLSRSLEEDGILSFSVKQGDGEEWTSEKMDAPRYFRYWQPESLQELVEASGYDILTLGNIDDSQKWLEVTCRVKAG